MPELPEVETLRQELDKRIRGGKIEDVKVRDSLVVQGALEKAVGQKIKRIERKGKILFWVLQAGVISFHLRMTGFFSLNETEKSVLELKIKTKDNVITVFFGSVRRFSRVNYLDFAEWELELQKLGPDWLKISFEEFYLLLRNRKGVIFSFLLNQRYISGLGNIYAQEALARSGISPLRLNDTIGRQEAEKLFKNIKKVLREGILAKGVSISDYRRLEGERGRFQDRLRVYRKEFCSVCGRKLSFGRISQRGVRWCSLCQS